MKPRWVRYSASKARRRRALVNHRLTVGSSPTIADRFSIDLQAEWISEPGAVVVRLLADIDLTRESEYDERVKRWSLIGVCLVCAMLVLPAAAISKGWCRVGSSASICSTAIASSGDRCCRIAPIEDSCCRQDQPESWEWSCSCSARAATDAVLPTDSRDRAGLPIASLPLDTEDGPPADSVSPRGSADLPPVSHTRRQATLCVWRQ